MSGKWMQLLRYELWAITIIIVLGIYSDTRNIWANDRDLEASQNPIENTSNQVDSTNRPNRTHSHTPYKKTGSTDRKMSQNNDKFGSIFSGIKQQWKRQHLKHLSHRQLF